MPIDIPKIVRETVEGIGYIRVSLVDAENCAVITAIDEQSNDIAMGVDEGLESKEGENIEDEIEKVGAGDQGIMFGFACTRLRINAITNILPTSYQESY